MCEGLEYPTNMERMRELELFSLEKRKLGEVLSMCIIQLIGGSKDQGARLLSMVPSDKTRGNEQKPKYRTFCLDAGEKKISRASNLTLGRIGQKACGAPSLEVLSTQLGTVLSNLLWLILLELSANQGQVW